MKIKQMMLMGALIGGVGLSSHAMAQDKRIATSGDIAVKKIKPAQTPAQRAKVMAVLKAVDEAQRKIKSFQANIRITREDSFTETKQYRLGKFLYLPGKKPKFSCHFMLRVMDGRKSKLDERYVFDGDYLVERHETEKLFKKYRVTQRLKKGEEDQYENPLAAGQGPFPIPFGQSAKHITRLFDAQIITGKTPEDPKKVNEFIHLRLKPKKHHRIKYSQIDFWYTPKTMVPIKGYAVDENENPVFVDFSKVAIDGKYDQALLSTQAPKNQKGWFIEIDENAKTKAIKKRKQ